MYILYLNGQWGDNDLKLKPIFFINNIVSKCNNLTSATFNNFLLFNSL